MGEFKKDDLVQHPSLGLGTVIQDEEAGKVEVHFSRAGNKRLALKYAGLRTATDEDIAQNREVQMLEQQLKAGANARRLETFVQETEGESNHYPGSHWEPFYEDHKALFKQLPEILPNALDVPGFSDLRDDSHPPFKPLVTWSKGFCLSWPNRKLGLLAALKQGEVSNEIMSISPFVKNYLTTAANVMRRSLPTSRMKKNYDSLK